MLTLYYSPGACSLSVHIALCEADIAHNLKKVDLATKKVADGSDFYTVNPKGYVPTIQLEDGSVLTECAAILFYIAETSKGLPINPGGFGRYRLQEALTFVSSELHKSIGAFFDPKLEGEYREKMLAKIRKRLEIVEETLKKTKYLAGATYSVADSYCYTILRWLNVMDIGIKIADFPTINTYWHEIKKRPMVQQAYTEENIKE